MSLCCPNSTKQSILPILCPVKTFVRRVLKKVCRSVWLEILHYTLKIWFEHLKGYKVQIPQLTKFLIKSKVFRLAFIQFGPLSVITSANSINPLVKWFGIMVQWGAAWTAESVCQRAEADVNYSLLYGVRFSQQTAEKLQYQVESLLQFCLSKQRTNCAFRVLLAHVYTLLQVSLLTLWPSL